MSVEFKPKRRADKDVISYFEFSGLRNDIPTHRFDASDLAVADNADVDKSHRVFRRVGVTKRLAIAAHSLWGNDTRAFFGSGTTLYELSANLTPSIVRGGMSGSRIGFCQPSDTVYFTDGEQTGAMSNVESPPVASDGSVNGAVGAVNGSADVTLVHAAAVARTWGIEPPPVPLVTFVAGDLTPGRYGVTATYIRNDGQESGAREADFFDVGAGASLQITLVPSADPGVEFNRLYVTTPDGELFLCYIETNTTTVVLSNDGINAMDEPLTTQFLSPPPAGHLTAYYKGHVFVAQDDVLYPSEPYSYELFDLRKFIRLDSRVTMLAPLEDRSGGDSTGFFIGTLKTCGILAGGGPDVFQYIPKTDYGAVPGAVTFVDGNLYGDGSAGGRLLPMWITRQGLCIGMPGLEVINLTRSSYGFPVGDSGSAIFISEKNRFIGGTKQAAYISMNTEVQALTTYSSFDYNSMTRFGARYFAASANGVFELVGDTDDGAQIDAQVSFGVTDFGSSFMKGLDRMYVGVRSVTPMNVEVKLEEKTAYQYVLDARPDERMDTQRVKTGKGLEGRYWQFTLRNTLGGDFQLDVVDVQSKQMTRRVNGRA